MRAIYPSPTNNSLVPKACFLAHCALVFVTIIPGHLGTCWIFEKNDKVFFCGGIFRKINCVLSLYDDF